ncbi:HCP-like protein [Piromyces finnis]|uniref:HCP-like protein n=1 Tax=Piromyces finnis TaxID=1754191 RepID=A0A1Y1VHJ8_9FUNG|nr:HCP-like protein [Piromyces finnis]|eukprot:ORX55241.1 HCP-like protein [Piromyces finnis]
MNDWFWLKVNILSPPKYSISENTTTTNVTKKCNFPKLYAITKIIMANKILFNGLQTIKNERRYRAKVYISSYYSSCEEVINIEKKALVLYKEAAILGCPIAFAIIGYYYENGLAGLPINYYKAERYYTLGLGNNKLNYYCKSPVGLSLIRLGFLKQYGRPGIVINQCISKKYKKQSKNLGPYITLHWLESLAKLEHISSLFIVASSYYNGLGVERNVEKAYNFAKIAAEYGHSGAQNLIGMINYEGTETLEKNEEMALKWYRKAANSNEAAALYNLAMLYENGIVVMQNYNEAFKYYKMASDFGSISGTNIIGFFHEHGIGTEKNKIMAFKYYSKAASKGSPFGQYNLGRCFLYGIGIEKNTFTAIKWFELAGLQGHGNSYLTLAVIHDTGIKVCRNERLAKKYYTLAYRNNIKSVAKRLEASIALDVLKASRYLLSNKFKIQNSIKLKNSNNTLFKTISSEQLDIDETIDETNSLLSILLNNFNGIDSFDNNNNNNNNNKEMNDNINTEQIHWSSSQDEASINRGNNTISIDKDTTQGIPYCSSYHSLTTSSSIETIHFPEMEDYTDNKSISSLEIEEIIECIGQFETTSKSRLKSESKKNFFEKLPNELKYAIINKNNPDHILSQKTMKKIFDYVIKDEYNFYTKIDFLNYLNIKEFKLEENNNSCRNTEERINSLIDQFYNNE